MKNLNKLALLAFSCLALWSCDKEDNTGKSTTPATKDVNGVITVPSATTIVVNESDEGVYNFSVTLDKPQVVDIHLHVKQIAGSATFGEDYETGDIVIPAYATTASGSLKIKTDCEVEGVENFTIQIGDIATSNATIPSKTLSFEINNSLSDDLDLTFDFNKSFSITGQALTLCGISYDMDYYVLDSNLDDTGIYDAATGACPEHLTLTSGSLPDGTYYIYRDIYDTGNTNGGTNTTSDGINAIYHDPFKIPTTVSYERCGGIDPGTFVQEDAFVRTTTVNSGFDYVMTIKVVNGVFTLENSTNAVLASGKSNKLDQVLSQMRARNNNKK